MQDYDFVTTMSWGTFTGEAIAANSSTHFDVHMGVLTVAYTGDSGARCTITYGDCLKIGEEGTDMRSWLRVTPLCHKGLPSELCENCHAAGISIYTFLIAACAIQLPLVIISWQRIFAKDDSRWRKFWSLPLAAAVVLGSINCWLVWRFDCWHELSDMLDQVLACMLACGIHSLM